MNNRGMTLVELLIVIVVMGIIAAFTVVSVGNIIQNTTEKVDEYNAQFVADQMEDLFMLGTLEIKNGRAFNTLTNRSYSGTGKSFYTDLEGSIGSRVIPIIPEAQNNYNKTGDGVYKFWFQVDGDEVNIFYWDEDKERVILAVCEIP